MHKTNVNKKVTMQFLFHIKLGRALFSEINTLQYPFGHATSHFTLLVTHTVLIIIMELKFLEDENSERHIDYVETR